jgi:hypothetical protein
MAHSIATVIHGERLYSHGVLPHIELTMSKSGEQCAHMKIKKWQLQLISGFSGDARMR